MYWHLLSLDAPTLAVLWAWSLARAAHAHAAVSAVAVLGLGTWLIYVADRLLDGRAGADPRELRERHQFHARHRFSFLLAGVAAAALLLGLIARMPAAARREDAALFGISMLYFAAVHQRRVRFRFPREPIVGVLFACACAVPAWSGSAAAHETLLRLAPLFAALCWLNCMAIQTWEHAERAPRWLISAAAVCIAAAAAASMLESGDPGALRLAAAVLTAALLLLALDCDRRRALKRAPQREPLSALALRILADAALLTPLLLMASWRG